LKKINTDYSSLLY